MSQKKFPELTIACIGAGYVGGPTMAMIAAKCPTYKVIVVDIDQERIRQWQQGNPPIYEPGLKELLSISLNRNLFFDTDIPKAIREASVIFVSVNTPTKQFGIGAGKAADLQFWEKTARQIREYANSDKIVIEKSTLPVRTAEAMKYILSSSPRHYHFEVLSNPEFLAEGSAIRDLEYPDRVLIGGDIHTESGRKAVQTLVDIYAHWVPREKILTTNVWSSELSKLTANAFLAQRISSINSISALCEHTEADVEEVAHAVGMDHRIGPHFLRAGVGFGGSCFKKDILNLVYLCEHFGLKEVAEYWEQVIKINEYQQKRFVNRIISAMFNTLVGKRIAIWGFAFKPNTGDTRESPAIYITKQLVQEQAIPVVSDPQALPNAKKDLAHLQDKVIFESDPLKAVEKAHALVVLTDWEEYRHIDFRQVYNRMETPPFVFDGRNCLPHEELYQIGFNVYGIGRVPKIHFDHH